VEGVEQLQKNKSSVNPNKQTFETQDCLPYVIPMHLRACEVYFKLWHHCPPTTPWQRIFF